MKHRTPFAATLLACAVAVTAGCAAAPRRSADAADRNSPPLASTTLRQLRDQALQKLLALADHEHPQVRANAIEGLTLAPTALASVVRRALADENLGVRFAAAMAVGKTQLRDARDWVRPLLSDSSPVVRAAAVYALRRLGEAADPTLLAQLLTNAADPKQRATAAFILGELGDASAIPLLKDAARRSMPRASLIELRLLRLQIAEALVKLGEERAVETIRAALYPSRPEELEATALACQIIGEVRDRRAADQLIYLTAQQGQRRPPAEVRLAAAEALAKLGLRNGGFLADELATDPNPVIRAQCASVYGWTGQAKDVAALEKLLADPSPLVQVAAAAGLLRATQRGAGLARDNRPRAGPQTPTASPAPRQGV
ncbi:MAG: hypothetical protein D6824_01695 [Planctomycetota bacterium]|nr:MAG: hypothetical protein D6824_01695 [Planctomycetota bacterium]